MKISSMGHSQRGVGQGWWVCFLLVLNLLIVQVLGAPADTPFKEVSALTTLASSWENQPQSWRGSDPCGSKWMGISCSNFHIISIELSGVGLTGNLPGDIGALSELQQLELSNNPGLSGPIPSAVGNLIKLKDLALMGCSFTGIIPPELGQLPSLEYLALNSNKFSGSIPGSLGNLSNLYWFDITDNQISGSLPVSDGTNFGLDMLTSCQHFHFSKNNLSGTIPPRLFHSNMRLIHVLFDNNNFSGSIPGTLGLVKSLEALLLDNNHLTGPVPPNLNNLTSLNELYLSNNQLNGPLPNLTGMNQLSDVEMSYNNFDPGQAPPWFSTLQSLVELKMEYLQIGGPIPPALFDLPSLQLAYLGNNHFNGTLNLGDGYSSQLQTVDLQNNDIQFVNPGDYTKQLLLSGSPYCNQPGANSKFCDVQQVASPSYSTPFENCQSISCPSDQAESPTCRCSYPFTGTIHFRFSTFNIVNVTCYQQLEKDLTVQARGLPVPLDSVSLQNPRLDPFNYLDIDLQFFPAGKLRFDELEVSKLSSMLSSTNFTRFGSYYFLTTTDANAQGSTSSGSNSKELPAIIGGTVGGLVLVAVIVGLIIYAIPQTRKAEKAIELSQPFGSWDVSKSSGSIPPPSSGPRVFTFEELKKFTNNFSEDNDIGSGGYGKVYRAAFPDGTLVAVKRAQKASMQGALEFRTEIEMLSRVHHRNLVSLVGFCFDQGEQMLVYEYFPNGTLKESLTGKSGIRLDWRRRLRIALGAARGLAYLHELANPPIIHRDIKSSNILLDLHLNAKISDFGLSRQLSGDGKGHITTQVKGTMGYLDPEYYMTQQLTEKSDVYSFGILLLEILTARNPIERGRYIVREVRNAMNKKKDLYGLHELLDQLLLGTELPGFERLVDLAMSCVEELGQDRPSMSQVTKEIENIMEIAGMNPHAGSSTISETFSSTDKAYPYNSDTVYDYSGGVFSQKVEPK